MGIESLQGQQERQSTETLLPSLKGLRILWSRNPALKRWAIFREHPTHSPSISKFVRAQWARTREATSLLTEIKLYHRRPRGGD
jgi:hypothetical protein